MLILKISKGNSHDQLKSKKAHTIADNDTIESILSDAFEQTVDAFITREEFKDVTLLHIQCFERPLDYYRNNFHNELKNQLAKHLELTDNDDFFYGYFKLFML